MDGRTCESQSPASAWTQRLPDYQRDPLDVPVGIRTKLGTETIIVADDDGEVRRALTSALRKYGFHVIEASTGEEAVRAAENEKGPIDFILADVVMPAMTTEQLQDRLAAARPKAVVAFMSGYIHDAAVRGRVLHGSVPFLPKPFTVLDLVRNIRTLLDGRRN